MKLIIGILASKGYDGFKNIWKRNILKFKKTQYRHLIDFYFLYSEEGESMDYGVYKDYYAEFDTNDTLMNSFIKRTFSIFSYLEACDIKYDFFMRTNISTLFNLYRLLEWLESKPRQLFICGSVIDNINHIYTHFSGTNLTMSSDLVRFLRLNRTNLLDESILSGDDERMSSIIVQNLDVSMTNMKRIDFVEFNPVEGLIDYVQPSVLFYKCKIFDCQVFCFRFKTLNREFDMKVMSNLLEIIDEKMIDTQLKEFVLSTVSEYSMQLLNQSGDFDDYNNNVFSFSREEVVWKTVYDDKQIVLL